MLDVSRIAMATGAPIANVESVWPKVLVALNTEGIGGLMCEVAAAATIGVETAAFLPIREERASRDRQPTLWALQERYWPSGFYGRGLIQLTWEKNYREYGDALGIDLVGNPDLLLDHETSARVLAHYFRTRGVAKAANDGDWRRVRLLVNGGYNGWDRFWRIVHILLGDGHAA